MAHKRPFPHALFICLKRRTSANPIPPDSKAIRLELAQNVQAVARVTCQNLVLTMGLPAAASKPLQISVERLFKDDLRPRVDEISAEDAKLLCGDDWGQMSRELSEQVAKTPETKAHWFLSVGADVLGCTAFKVWPTVMAEPTAQGCPSRQVLHDALEVMILERFAVVLNMRGLPKGGTKL